jgi:hypothetical protein
MENPSKYGMTNVTDPCRDFLHPAAPTCSTPARYFYYYNGHPSDAAHHIVGDELYAEVLRLPPAVPEPSTWAMTASAAAAFRRALRKIICSGQPGFDRGQVLRTATHATPALARSEGDKEWRLYAARAGLPIGVASHRSFVSLARSPVAKAPTNRPAPPPFSSIMAPQALVGSQAG